VATPQTPLQNTGRGDTDSESISSDDKQINTGWENLGADLAIVWKRFNVAKSRRQKWIKEKANNVVINHEKKFQLKVMDEEFNELVVTAAESIAEQYMRALQAKANS
jgi:hypothetical protein